MVFYLKYRPQTIEELDSTSLRETLASILTKASPSYIDIPHAFLFTGPKGLGKTSTARIIAKAVNCERVPKVLKVPRVSKGEKKSTLDTPDTHDTLDTLQTIEPCNICEMCVSITNGTNMDILEIDAASNRGIDEIRDLKEKIRLAPLSARKKIYIIDEVHMLTTEAFNALLKTLEEPPPHALFILCTTEPHKIPKTILSRCFHITFHPATASELERSFMRIIKQENIAINADAMSCIAALADGSFRDGVKVLEELVAKANGKMITKEFVEEKYKVSSISYFVSSMIESLVKKDTKKGITLISKLVEDGSDIKYFFEQVMMELHGMLLEKLNTANLPAGKAGSKEQRESIKPVEDPRRRAQDQEGEELSVEELIQLLQMLQIAHSDAKYAVLPQLPYEIVLLEWTDTTEVKGSTTITTSFKRDDRNVTIASMRRQIGNIEKIKALSTPPKIVKPAAEDTPTDDPVSLLHFSGSGDHATEWIDTFWKEIITRIQVHNYSIAGVLRGCVIKSYDNKNLIIETAYKFHKDKLDNNKAREILEKACKELTGNPVTIEIVLKNK